MSVAMKVFRWAVRSRYRFKLTPLGQAMLFWPKNAWVNALYSLSKGLTKVSGKTVALTKIPPYFGPEPTEFEHEVAIFVRCFNEGPYLDEFIAYYLSVGVTHFYIYDNNSQDNTAEVLAPYVEKGYVSHIIWPTKPPTPTADVDVIVRSRDKVRWLLYVDADEFVFPIEGDSIVPVMKQFEKYPAVGIANLFFGNGGIMEKPDGLVIESYLLCNKEFSKNVKSIINPRRVIRTGNSHFMIYRGWQQAVDENGVTSQGGACLEPSGNKIRLNHYYCKSYEEYLKKIRPDYYVDVFGQTYRTRREDNIPKVMAENNDLEDLKIQRFVEKTKAKLAEFGRG